MSTINWRMARVRVRAALRRINPLPISVRRVTSRGVFDSVSGSVGDDTYSTFDVVGVPISAHAGAAFSISTHGDVLGPLLIRNDLDIIFAGSGDFSPMIGDIAVLSSGERVIIKVEPYRATFDVDLAYGCKFAEA